MTTADDVIACVRRRPPLCELVDVEQPVTADEILVAFETRMALRPDLGLLNRAANLFLESGNPFEPSRRRKPKMETVVFGTLFVLIMAALLFFNLAAPRVQVIR